MKEQIREVDKNDVDISELFKWNKEVEIEDAYSNFKVKFYMRLLGDADLGRARAYAYRNSSELRKNLKEQGSDERTSLLAEPGDFVETDVIMKSIEILRITDMYQSAMKNINIPVPKEPAGDELEKWEDYQEKVDNYATEFKAGVDKEVERLKKIDSDYLAGKNREELYKIYENEVINKLCQEEMNNKFYDMSIFLATFKDDKFKTPAFKNFDTYDNIRPALKERLKEEYQKLEMGIEILKKLPEATE